MSVNFFVDTNLLVYFHDASEPVKQPLAAKWLSYLWENKCGRLSFQVLNEYYVTVTKKLSPGLPNKNARADIRNLMVWQPVTIDQKIIERGWHIQERYQFSWWDSLIISAAQLADCRYLLSEDMQHEQQVDNMTILNPFQITPDNVAA